MPEWRLTECGEGLVVRLTASADGIRAIQFRLEEAAEGERGDR